MIDTSASILATIPAEARFPFQDEMAIASSAVVARVRMPLNLQGNWIRWSAGIISQMGLLNCVIMTTLRMATAYQNRFNFPLCRSEVERLMTNAQLAIAVRSAVNSSNVIFSSLQRENFAKNNQFA